MNMKGIVTNIFVNKPNGFKIATVSISDARTIPLEKRNPSFPDSITVAGVLKGVEKDYVTEFFGEWERRENGNYWPWQFKVSDYTVCELETPKLLRKFLCDLPGVSEQLAMRIMRYFNNPQDIIVDHPDRLTELKGIDRETAIRIRAAFLDLKEKRNLEAFLRKYGVKQTEAQSILSAYGTKAMEYVKQNPYRLCDEGFLSFHICDKIGQDLNFKADSICRLATAISYVLDIRAGARGHTYLTDTLLIEETNAFFKENAVIEGAISKELLSAKMSELTSHGMIVYDHGKFYHTNRYANETEVASILLHRLKLPSRFSNVSSEVIEQCVDDAEKEVEISLDEVQREAVISGLNHMTSVLTGGPGSGKTTILSVFMLAIEKLCKRLGLDKPIISLAAPTGMATKRMANSSGREAKTVHKLFDIRYDVNEFREEPKTVLSDVIILDEVSMLDIDVMACVMRSVRDDTIMIMVGDVDQLPSIGPGTVLKDIIDFGEIPVTRLKYSYRHGSRKNILENAQRINSGDENLITNRSDFVFIKVSDRANDKECHRLRAVTERVFYEEYMSGGRDMYRVQVISPLRSKTDVSVDSLNNLIQKIANPQIDEEEQITFGKVVFRKGDKVMQTKNNYDKGVCNGDIGEIKLVSVRCNKLLVDFQGLLVEYTANEFEQLKHAYAITVHKSQGSEHPVVIMVMTNYHSMMLVRNLFYTAVTRAKQRLILIGDPEAVKYAIRNTKGTQRLSALCERLKIGWEMLHAA